MKGKKKNRRKVGKIILLCMSFLLTIVLTFTSTLAWFYDSDWASNSVTMAGTVGIEIRRKPLSAGETGSALTTSGSGELYFNITTDKAYPGQAIDVSARVYNNGGRSGAGGSPCFIRAHFAVYTNVGVDDPATPENEADPNEQIFNSRVLYNFLNGLVDAQNEYFNNTSKGEDMTDYYWRWHQESGAKPLTDSGIGGTPKYYFEGDYKDASDVEFDGSTTLLDRGYFYLCGGENTSGTPDTTILKAIAVDDEAVFLWNDTFIIPWQLTNLSADKHIFVAVTFQAVQTFIPRMEANGIINQDPDNQLPLNQCAYNNLSVQTVFNSSAFTPFELTIDTDKDGDIDLDFSGEGYDCISTPATP